MGQLVTGLPVQAFYTRLNPQNRRQILLAVSAWYEHELERMPRELLPLGSAAVVNHRFDLAITS